MSWARTATSVCLRAHYVVMLRDREATMKPWKVSEWVRIVRYEDMLSDPARIYSALAEWLNIESCFDLSYWCQALIF